MARNGAGVYSLYAIGNPVVTGTVISSAWANNTLTDMATALTQSIASTGVTTPTANLPMGGFRHTGAGVAVARTDYALTSQAQDGSFTYGGLAGGTADAITLSLAPAITSYVAGQRFTFQSGASDNTTATPTININGVGANTILRWNGQAIVAGDIPANSIVNLLYYASNFRLVQRIFPLSTTMLYSGRTSNTILNGNDIGSFIDITSGTFTQTFTAAATLGNGWWVRIRNRGTGRVTIPSSDGIASWAMYTGEVRDFITDGTLFYSILLEAGSFTTITTDNFIVPPGLSWLRARGWGGGGGGGGGCGGAAGTSRPGGAAGGGAARAELFLVGAQIPAANTTIPCTIGAGGTGGAGGTSASGSNGTAGGNTTFGTYMTAYGGGYGAGGIAGTDISGGAGGGVAGAGSNGSTIAAEGGEPRNAILGTASSGGAYINNISGGGAAVDVGGITAGCAEYGGAAGGGVSGLGATSGTGGSSIYGGCGGGAGGGVTAANASSAGATAGLAGSYSVGGGSAGGANTGAAGNAGVAGSLDKGGGGGGGGGGNAAGTGGIGGTGGTPGGGGGGGGGGTLVGGAGAAGGAGLIEITWG